jgi:hypothetical protein
MHMQKHEQIFGVLIRATIVIIFLNLLPFRLPAFTVPVSDQKQLQFYLTPQIPRLIDRPKASTTPSYPRPVNLNSRALVSDDDFGMVSRLQNGGSFKVVDYGDYSLWKFPYDSFGAQFSRNGQIVSDQIFLPGGRTLDKNLAARSYTYAGEEQRLWVVQFVGPILPEWLTGLSSKGLQTVAYLPNNAYLVWGRSSQVTGMYSLPFTLWSGLYLPEYRSTAAVNLPVQPDKTVNVTVQLYRTSMNQNSLKQIRASAKKILAEPYQMLNYTYISVNLPQSNIAQLTRLHDVMTVIPWVAPVKNDEIQGQIVAGNIKPDGTRTLPAAPGYLQWVKSLDFPTDPSKYPLVDIVDDGIDNGSTKPLHPDFYRDGSMSKDSRLVYNTTCTSDTSANGLGGHGTINAGIVGSYNAKTDAPHVDSDGYNRSVGVAPYARLGGTKIFGGEYGFFDISGCGNSYAGLVANSYKQGADMTSNSWGAAVRGIYNESSQAYDILTRQPVPNAKREMLHVFAAGNSGMSGAQTVGSPGTAKNVLTVGASENVRSPGIADGCGQSNANNADDIANFSSRGPTADGRAKPDIIAPGTHIQGPASQDPGFHGGGVCGGTDGNGNRSKYYPIAQDGITQTLYTWSSGTSHSTPAVAGGAALVYNWYNRELNPGAIPSPAMLKALLINSTRYATGDGANDKLPGMGQGWGQMNLGMTFDDASRQVFDQSHLFYKTGQSFSKNFEVKDKSKPVRVTLVWSDAPSGVLACTVCLVNNLDLEVRVNGELYKGNVFVGAHSVVGGNADTRNNVENVYLPAGTTGVISVKVKATNLAGSGVPGKSGLNQDFALVVYNGN